MKFLRIIIIGLLALGSLAQAGSSSSSYGQNRILLSPMSLLFGVVGARYERQVFDPIFLGAGFQFFERNNDTTVTHNYAYDLYAEYYHVPHDHQSPWIELGYGFNYRDQLRSANGNVVTRRNIGRLLLGLSWTAWEKLQIKLGGGISWIPADPNTKLQPSILWLVSYWL